MLILSWENFIKHSEVIPDFENGSGVTVGCFDGFHLGHQKIFQGLIKNCSNNNLIPGIITFGKKLSSIKSSFENSGNLSKQNDFSFIEENYPEIKFCVVVDFTPDFAKKTGAEFFLILKDKINLKFIIEGTDFKCGYKGSMGMEEIKVFGTENNIKTEFVEPVFLSEFSSERISSSFIRKLIYEGNFFLANKMLGFNYFLDFSDCKFNYDFEKKMFYLDKKSLSQIVPQKGKFLIQNENGTEVELSVSEDYILCNKEINKAIFIK